MLIVFWEVILTLVVLLIAWRLFEGLQSKFRNGETTFLLHLRFGGHMLQVSRRRWLPD